MSTTYNSIFDRALSKMKEYSFLRMEDEEIYTLLTPYLKSAENDFARICVESLSATDDLGYLSDLSDESVDILALGIVCHWMTAYVADADKLRNLLGTKDFSVFSPANLLTSVRNARADLLLEYHDKINRYSYIYGNVFRDHIGG